MKTPKLLLAALLLALFPVEASAPKVKEEAKEDLTREKLMVLPPAW